MGGERKKVKRVRGQQQDSMFKNRKKKNVSLFVYSLHDLDATILVRNINQSNYVLFLLLTLSVPSA